MKWSSIRSSLLRDRKKWETNSEPQSEVTWDGVPCFENTWVRNSWASSSKSMESWVGMKRDCLVRWCRWENGSMHIPPMETSFGHWNTSLLSQDENPIIGRIFAGNTNIWFFRCLPNRDVISSLNPPNSHDPNGGTYIRISGLLREK